MAHALSFARMNSDTVRKGTPWTCMTVAASRWRGPVSPAGRISIYGRVGVGLWLWLWERECELNERRRREGGGTHVDGGDHAAVGDVQAVWWEGGVSGAGQGTRWRGRKEERKGAHRLVHGECVAVKLSSPARASRARRKACACGGPPSTMQKISCVVGGWVG